MQKPKIRNKSGTSVVSPSENYNIIKFSLNSSTGQPVKERQEKKPRKRAEKPAGNVPNPRKKPKIEEASPNNQAEPMSLPPSNAMMGFKGMNFQPYFNSVPQPSFGFINSNTGNNNNNNNMQFGEESQGIAMDPGQKFQGNYLPFTNLYSLLNDANNKEILGLLNSAMMGEQVSEILVNFPEISLNKLDFSRARFGIGTWTRIS